MDQRLLAYAADNAPRYTSYPTAPHFSDAVTPDVYAGWLGALDPDERVSLYLHVPYCRELCYYCACHTFAAQRDSVVADYVDALIREIDLVAKATPARILGEIHWGGGTPNILSAQQFERVVSRIDFWFDLTDMREHSIELDPRVVTQQKADAYGAMGVTRASFGVQDLNLHVQQAIGRVQPFSMVRAAADRLRRAGVRGLNLDIMYGLPGQSVEDVRRTIQQALLLQPSRVAAFGYAHVPWFKARQRLINADALPTSEQRVEQADTIRAEMLAAGYRAIGFDHFAWPDDSLAVAARRGKLHRNFQGYVDDPCSALIGVGASSISTLPQGYAQNASEVGAWMRAVIEGQLPIVRGRALTDEDRVRRALIDHLLCQFGVDLNAFGGVERYRDELERLKVLRADGLVRIDGAHITMTPEARPLVRVVAKIFDAYAADSGARHSNSV